MSIEPEQFKVSNERMRQVLRLLIERDGFVCGICGGEITDVFEADVDHIIPKIKGGGDNSENLQPAHMHCNREKSGKILPHIQLKAKCAKVDKIMKLRDVMIEGFKKNAVKSALSHDDFFKQAIRRKKKADEFLEGVIAAKTKPNPVKKIPKRIPLSTQKVHSDAPIRLWNELATNGFKNLSVNIFLSYFDEYRNATSEFITK